MFMPVPMGGGAQAGEAAGAEAAGEAAAGGSPATGANPLGGEASGTQDKCASFSALIETQRPMLMNKRTHACTDSVTTSPIAAL